MQRYRIMEAKVDEGKQMRTCSPPPMYENIASVRFETDDGARWLHCVEALGYHEFYLSEEDLHDKLVEMADEDEELIISRHIEELDGMDLFMAAADEVDADEALENAESFEEWATKHAEFMSSYPAYPLARYALALSEMWRPEDVEKGIEEGVGKYADEIDFGGFLRRFERPGTDEDKE